MALRDRNLVEQLRASLPTEGWQMLYSVDGKHLDSQVTCRACEWRLLDSLSAHAAFWTWRLSSRRDSLLLTMFPMRSVLRATVVRPPKWPFLDSCEVIRARRGLWTTGLVVRAPHRAAGGAGR